MRFCLLLPAAIALLAVACGPAAAPGPPGGAGQTDEPKAGGTLKALLREDPSSLSIHEDVSTSLTWPVMLGYNNLVKSDPTIVPESLQTIRPELAQKWEISPDGKSITFTLNQPVKWHDGTLFTARDIKYTFDTLKTGTDALRPEVKMRGNPRTAWYANVEAVEAPNDATAVFRLKRPQPSLLGMLASGYTPIYPSHVPVSDLRTKVVGTGPFKLVEWRKGEAVIYTKNQEYWRPNHPYMEGVHFVIIVQAATQLAAMKTHQIQVSHPGELTKANVDELTQAVPLMVAEERVGTGSDNIPMNTRKAPWSDQRVRLAVAEALDREAYLVARGRGAVIGTYVSPAGPFAPPKEQLAQLPGYGPNMEERRARAKHLLAEAGYPNGFTTEVSTRDIRLFTDLAPWTLDQLARIGIKATLKVLETPVYNTAMVKGDFEIASGSTALGSDDPDVMFYENLRCGETRNYSQWCDAEVDRLTDLQSATLDSVERKRIINQMDRMVVESASRPLLGWRNHYEAWWPEVRGYKAMASVYATGPGRLDDVWLAQ